ncbi:hemerythrin [Bradyrhizobium macuxiense]|uniref:Hemerythrin n=1 Tax=Bradyrhizobium macuxiense TaxID=1755647 RepID=A0A120FN28_9BRAD|nr:hemerythrin [Bradyrhizobium macuxiense]
MIVDLLRREHRSMELLLAVLQRELEIFERGERPDYEVIRAVICYFQVYPEVYHHPQEDLIFSKLRIRDPDAAASLGDITREHHEGADRLRHFAQAIDAVLADRDILRQEVGSIVRNFIVRERDHMVWEEQEFFPTALKALFPQDWMEIGSALTDRKDPLFSEAGEATSDAVKAHILQLAQEAEAERHSPTFSSAIAAVKPGGAKTDGPSF